MAYTIESFFLPCNPYYPLLSPNRTSCPLSCKFFGDIPCKGREARLLISREKFVSPIFAANYIEKVKISMYDKS